MIVIDTSALMAIILDEPAAETCMKEIEHADGLLISAGTIAELLIVADRRAVGEEMRALIDGLGLEVITVTGASARRIVEAYVRWGKGAHPASLNFGDCFAYELAMQHRAPLLYVGEDFARTDVQSAV